MKKLILVLCLSLISSLCFAVSLEWDANDPAEQVTEYRIYTVKHGSTLVATVVASSTTVNVDAYLQGNRTNFIVTAVNAVGESSASPQVTVQRH